MAEPPSTEKTITAKPAIVEFSRVEQKISAEFQVIEQATTIQSTLLPPSKCLQNTFPLPSQDEGYGHGITLDSMIVTPRVPTLVEESTNIRTEGESETPEEITENFLPTPLLAKRLLL